jgi:DNA-binding NarL/FixJ family response regulator
MASGHSPATAKHTRQLSSSMFFDGVLGLIGRGLKTGEIAKTLHPSVHTVEAHRANIKRKLGVRTTGALTRTAFDLSAPAAC